MGVVPSRETLLGGLVHGPSSTATKHLDGNALASKKGLRGTQDIVLVPLIPEYFPSADSQSFQLFLSVCREDSLFSLYTRCLFDTADAAHQESDVEMYDYFMSIGRQRLFQTDSELLAVYRAGRVFSPVPCVVGLVRESVRLQSSLAMPSNHSSLKSVISPLELDSLGTLHMIGFIGDMGFCPSSLPQNRIKDTPYKLGLFLSNKVGGNLRSNVTCMAAYTFITQLRRIGIVDSPMTFGSYDSVYNTPEVQEYDNSDNLMKPGEMEEKDLACDKLQRITHENWENANISGNVVFRPLEFFVDSTNIPWMCYLRELRALIATCTLKSKESSKDHVGLLLGEKAFTKQSLVAYVDGDVLRGTMNSDDVKKAAEWACWFYEMGLNPPTGCSLAHLRATLREESMKCSIEGRVYVDPAEPSNVQHGDVWIVGSGGFVYEKTTGDYTQLLQGSILLYNNGQWCMQDDWFAEDILLSVCREECQLARRADPDDPHWARDANGFLIWDTGGFCRWKFTRNGLTLTYRTVPSFSKTKSSNAQNTCTAYKKRSQARSVLSESSLSADPMLQVAPNSCQMQSVDASDIVGSLPKSSSIISSICGKQTSSNPKNTMLQRWANASWESTTASFPVAQFNSVGAKRMQSYDLGDAQNTGFPSSFPVSRDTCFHAPPFFSSSLSPSIHTTSICSPLLMRTHAHATAPLRDRCSSSWKSFEAQAEAPTLTRNLLHASTDDLHFMSGYTDTPSSSVGSAVRFFDRQGKYRWNWGRPSP